MKVVSVETLQKTVTAYLDSVISRQKEIRDYWAGVHDVGEGNSFLHSNNLTVAQEGLDFLLIAKRGATCDGCTVRSRTIQLELEAQRLQRELKDLKETI